jgi:hypothetical protein
MPLMLPTPLPRKPRHGQSERKQVVRKRSGSAPQGQGEANGVGRSEGEFTGKCDSASAEPDKSPVAGVLSGSICWRNQAKAMRATAGMEVLRSVARARLAE